MHYRDVVRRRFVMTRWNLALVLGVGTLLVQVRNGRAKIVGIGPPQLLGDRE